MTHLDEITTLMRQSAEHIDEHGHHQFDMWDGKACCIMGAPRMIAEEGSYGHIIRPILNRLGYGEDWNDKPERTKEEVVDALNSVADKLDEPTLREVFGERWKEVLDMIVDVDDWTKEKHDSFTNAPWKYTEPKEMPDPGNYLNSLAAFMATVMTSQHAVSSMPYKEYFDREWKDLQS